jgi:hypothetical protein
MTTDNPQSTSTPRPTEFHYRMSGGLLPGRRTYRARLSSEGLTLSDGTVEFYNLYDCAAYGEKALAISVNSPDLVGKNTRPHIDENNVLPLVVEGPTAPDLARQIKHHLSQYRVEQRRKELQEQGQADEFRTMTCPRCDALVDLSGCEPTRYVYCPWCRALMSADGRPTRGSDTHGVCPECRLFSRLETFSIRHFHFLLFVNRARTWNGRVCPRCLVMQAGPALVFNVPFLLGVPSALGALTKARRTRSRQWPDLARANRHIERSEYEQAEDLLRMMLHSADDHPGLLLNLATARAGTDLEAAHAALDRALNACANYEPAHEFREVLYYLEETEDELLAT